MAKVLVTGGAGFVGREVARQLRALGYSVRVLSRDAARGRLPAAQYGVEVVPGDVGDAAAVEEACQGVDAVVHLVGILYEKGKQTFQAVHVEGTEHVVRAAERAGVSRYIHMSALGERHSGGAYDSEYHRTKALAEAVVRRSRLDWTIFRPSLIFGPGDGFVNGLAALMRFPASLFQLHSFPLIGGGRTLLQPVSISDVGIAFSRAIAHPDAVGKTYDLVGPERLPLREIAQEIAAALGKRTVVEGFPWRLLGRSALLAAVALVPLLLLLAALPPLLAKPGVHLSLWIVPLHKGFLLPLPAGFFVAGIVFWLALAVALVRSSRTLILFHLPWPAAFAAGAVLGLLPKPPLTMGQVWMLKENNIGDAAPATTAFALPLKGFREGIREYLYHPRS